jgi:hypothetical protein
MTCTGGGHKSGTSLPEAVFGFHNEVMTVIAASVAALQILRKYKCPHCGAEQERVLPSIGASLECTNCLRTFSPEKCAMEKRKPRKRRR